MSSLHDVWAELVSQGLTKSDEGYRGSIRYAEEKGGVFATWHLLDAPETNYYFEYAIDIGCIAWRHPYRTLFLDWAVQIADRALADPRWELTEEDIAATRHLRKKGDPVPRWWKKEGIYPGNHGETLRNSVLAHAMQEDAEPDRALLAQAGREIIEGVTQKKRHHWDQIEQSAVLRGVHLLLIAGEVAEAKKAISLKRRGFAWIQHYYDFLKAFVLAIPDDAPHIVTDPAQIAAFEAWFDKLRDPHYRAPSWRDGKGEVLFGVGALWRLELALIKQQYLLGKPYAGQWQPVCELISA